MKKIFFLFFLFFLLYSCKKSDKTEINFAYYDTDEASLFIKKKIDEYNKNNPKIKVIGIKLQKNELTNKIKKGQIKIDLIRYSSNFLEEFTDKNLITNFNNSFDPSFFDLFQKEALSTVTYKKKIMGIPDNFGDQLLLFYNKKIIDKIPETSDELFRLLETKLRYKNEIKGLVFNQEEPDLIFPFLYGFGLDAKFDSENNELDKSEISDILDFIYNLKFKYNLLPETSDYEEAKKLFKTEKAATIINGSWAFSDYKKYLSDNLGVSDFPIISLTGKKPLSWASTNCYSIIKKRINIKKKEIMAFIIYMTSEKTQEEWLNLDRLPSIASQNIIDKINKDSQLNEAYQILLKVKARPSTAKISLLSKAFRPYLSEMLEGRISPDTAANNIEKYYYELSKSTARVKNAKK